MLWIALYMNIKKYLKKYDINDVKEKIQLIDDLTTLLSKLDRAVIRDEYIKKICRGFTN